MSLIERVSRDASVPHIIKNVSQLSGLNLERLPLHKGFLMCRPDDYFVGYEINEHMVGNIGKVDRDKAVTQWMQLKATLEGLGAIVHVMKSVKGNPDMVFAANAGLTLNDGHHDVCIMSQMRHPERQGESRHYVRSLYQSHYGVEHLSGEVPFEGAGDALWHPGTKVLWGGYGPRSSKEAYEQISVLLGIPVITLNLVDKRFYHLDTCFCPIDPQTVMYYPKAFTLEGQGLIEAMFMTTIKVSEEEAMRFACNSIPVNKTVVMPAGCPKTIADLKVLEYIVIEVPMSEYLKGGGAAKCLVLEHYGQ